MTGREMLNELNAKVAGIEQENATMKAELAQVKATAEAAETKADAILALQESP